MTRPDPHLIVLFGASGDLAKRKLIPGLFHLAAAGLLPENYRIVGSSPARSALSHEDFRAHARDAVATYGLAEPTGEAWTTFEASLSYGAADTADPKPLLDAVKTAEDSLGGQPQRLFHLAVPPDAATSLIAMLGDTHLADDAKVIVEKPFGTDLRSAEELNETLHAVFDESRIFRIDHFLGKEAVDNILAFRFANGLFEPIWNRDHISSVQIDVPESIGIEGRARFFEETGTFRDMLVTHLIQVLGIVAMEPPASLEAGPVRDEKAKVFMAMRPIDPAQAVRGQYDGYRQEAGVAPDSGTETFVALRVEVDNWRWAGVPFFLRSGKSLGQGRQLITLGLREPPLRMFPTDQRAGDDAIVIDFGDPGWIDARFLAKRPGPEMHLVPAHMTFSYADTFRQEHGLEGYERLILDAMRGDQSLFTRADSIERIWEVADGLLKNPPPVAPYAPGSWGPEPAVTELIAPYRWSLPGA